MNLLLQNFFKPSSVCRVIAPSECLLSFFTPRSVPETAHKGMKRGQESAPVHITNFNLFLLFSLNLCCVMMTSMPVSHWKRYMCGGHVKAPHGSGGGYTAQEVLLCYSLAYTKLTMANMPVVLEPMICTGNAVIVGSVQGKPLTWAQVSVIAVVKYTGSCHTLMCKIIKW